MMRKAVWRVGRLILGCLMLPVSWAACVSVYVLIKGIAPMFGGLPAPVWWLVGGFGVWVFMFLTLPRPVKSYVLAHELTHALWGWLMGARVSGIRVKEASGSVTLSKTNFLIILAPYFFPLYTVLLLVLYAVLSLFFDVERYHLWWMGMIGFTWGFHATFTVSTLMQRQSDIRECGHVFSYALIVLMNVLGIGLWVVAVSPATLEQLVFLLQHHVTDTFAGFWDGVMGIVHRLQ